ncbi:MAG: hypothetical protein ACUVUR_03385 [bacterium]
MNDKKSIKGILMVAMLSGLALAYLYQHSLSVRTMRELVQLEQKYRLATERVESLQVEVERLESFCRLESLWVANREIELADREPAVESLTVAGVENPRLLAR